MPSFTTSWPSEPARSVGDVKALLDEAAAFEEFGVADGVPSVSTEAAVLWLSGGAPERALNLTRQVTVAGLQSVGRDVDFLSIVTSLVEVGAALRLEDIVADGAKLLEPYAGRAVLNAGAVVFHGGVGDHLTPKGRERTGGATPSKVGRHASTSCGEVFVYLEELDLGRTGRTDLLGDRAYLFLCELLERGTQHPLPYILILHHHTNICASTQRARPKHRGGLDVGPFGPTPARPSTVPGNGSTESGGLGLGPSVPHRCAQ